MQNKQLIALLVIALFSCVAAKAQLKLRGVIYSEGPIQAALSVESYPETHFLYLDTKHNVDWNGQKVFKTNYDLPWDVVKDYNHTIKFTDGTVEKIVFIDGTVPEDIVPKQKYFLDIDLTNQSTADVMIVVFWSLQDDAYVALPYTEVEEIRRRCVDPSIYKGSRLLNLVKKN